jgi:hypothetical protein
MMSPESLGGETMRLLLASAVFVSVIPGAMAQDGRVLDKAIADALRDVHERGRYLHNEAGDSAAAYRMYQGGLAVARGVLSYRPELQRLIADGLAAADREPTVQRRAFALHEVIERVRSNLKDSGQLKIPPREIKGGTKPPPKPSAKVGEVTGGVVGRVLWQGAPMSGLDVTFVTLGRQPPRVHETMTGPQGVYAIPELPPGKYVVLITPSAKAAVKKLPERYATSTTSPLVFDIKAGGEKLDFVLQ